MSLIWGVILDVFQSVCGFILCPIKVEEHQMREMCSFPRNNKLHPVVRQPNIDACIIDIIENFRFLGALTDDNMHVIFVHKTQPFHYVAVWVGTRTCAVLGNSYQLLNITNDPDKQYVKFAFEILDQVVNAPDYYGICSYSTRYRFWKFLQQQKPWKVVVDPNSPKI